MLAFIRLTHKFVANMNRIYQFQRINDKLHTKSKISTNSHCVQHISWKSDRKERKIIRLATIIST